MPDAHETPQEKMPGEGRGTPAPRGAQDADFEEDEGHGTTYVEAPPKDLRDLRVPGAMVATNLGCVVCLAGVGVSILVAVAMARHVMRNAPDGLDTPNALGVGITGPLVGLLTVKAGYALCARLRLRTSQPLFAGEPLLPRMASWGVAIVGWTFLGVAVLGGLILLVLAIRNWLGLG